MRCAADPQYISTQFILLELIVARDLIVFIGGDGANDAPRVLMEDYCAAVAEIGETAITVDVTEQAEIEHLADLMRTSRVRFAVTWLGALQDLSFQLSSTKELVNGFEVSGVPLIKIQGDIPAYFRARHRDVPKNSASLYQADEFLTYRRLFMPEATAIAAMLPPMPMMPTQRSQVDLKRRAKGPLIFQKNGNSPSELEGLWRERLPKSVAALLFDLADAIRSPGLAPGRLDIGSYVAAFLKSVLNVDPPGNDAVALLTAQIDDYLRRVKSTMIAEALLDFPIVVQGSYWDHVDFRGRVATRIPGGSVRANGEEVESRLGVIDMSPNVDTWPHDRIQRAVGSYSLVLTNEQSWLRSDFPGFEAMLFRFDPDSIRETVAAVLRKPGEHIERAIAFAEAFRARHPRSAFAETLIRVGDLAGLSHNPTPPQLQNYFIWS